MRQTHGTTAIARPRYLMMTVAMLTFLGIGLGGADLASAGVEYDQDVTPDAILGSGNPNGNFTTDRRGGIELGLRGKIPFTLIINSEGDGTYRYTFNETDHDSNGATPRRWNFDWTVNTDFDDSSGLLLDDLRYELGLDGDPGQGVDFLKFDPITPTVAFPFYDHSIGDNSTANGAGVEAGDAATYASLLANKNVLQQSWRYAFYSSFPPLDTYNPNVAGTYAVYLLAKNTAGKIVARTDIQVIIGISPPAGPILSCKGFEPPMNLAYLPPAIGGGLIARKVKRNKVLPFKAQLVDTAGNVVTNLASPPEIHLVYTDEMMVSTDVSEFALAPGKGSDGQQFTLAGETWTFNLSTKTSGQASSGLIGDAGTYTATMVSPDLSEYVIDPTCKGVFIIE